MTQADAAVFSFPLSDLTPLHSAQTKVDSTKDIKDYDEDTQAEIRRIMFDQEQKRKGLPTSDEMRNQELLRKAWHAEGSPFAGQPFDPAAVNFGGGAAMPNIPFPSGGPNVPLPFDASKDPED